MSTTGRALWFLVLPLLLVAGLGLLAWWKVRSLLAPAPTPQYDTPTQLASVSVPHQPNSLAWSADGAYLAAGTWGRATGETGPPSEVVVVDVAKASALTTLQAKSWVGGVAFSPDGKWLAVATRPTVPAGAAPAEVVVFDVPAFTAKFTANAGGSANGFIDLAWAADGKSLHAIEGPVDNAQGKSEVRRWAVPAFTEQPAIRASQLNRPAALAVSPDGRTLALAEETTASNKLLIRLFDLGKGTERSSFKVGDNFRPPQLGFTADGKAVGVFETNRLSWWDVATGRPAKPSGARFAVQPAGLSDVRSSDAVAPDGSWQARGYGKRRGFGDLGWDNRAMEFGAFVEVTDSAAEKTRTWRVSESSNMPVVAFSPDGTRLAGTVGQASSGAILIWAAPE